MKQNGALTPKQRATLKAIVRLHRKRGIPPTQRELMGAFGITQNAIRDRLRALVTKGFIIVIPNVARGIVLTPRRADAVARTEGR